MAVESLGEFQLRTHTICTGNQNRFLNPPLVEAATEATQSTYYFRSVGAMNQNSLYKSSTSLDINTCFDNPLEKVPETRSLQDVFY